MKKEIYKDVPGYEGLYQVSNWGNVVSLKHRWGIRETPRKVCDTADTRGYRQLNLSKDGKKRLFKVHQLVAMAFLGHICDGHNTEVHHIDEDKTNNFVWNLQVLKQDGGLSAVRQNKVLSCKGTYYSKSKNRWVSEIRIDGKRKYLGLFKIEQDGLDAYQKALDSVKKQ